MIAAIYARKSTERGGNPVAKIVELARWSRRNRVTVPSSAGPKPAISLREAGISYASGPGAR
jgi:hypothetical protein